MARVTPESCIKAECLKYLERRRIYAWNNPTGAVTIRPGQFMHFGKVGSADILGILPGGRFLAIECKAEYGRLSDEQARFLAEIRGLGGLAIVARSFKDIASVLRREGYVNDGLLFAEPKAVN